MKKKEYIKPCAEVVEIDMIAMIASSDKPGAVTDPDVTAEEEFEVL